MSDFSVAISGNDSIKHSDRPVRRRFGTKCFVNCTKTLNHQSDETSKLISVWIKKSTRGYEESKDTNIFVTKVVWRMFYLVTET